MRCPADFQYRVEHQIGQFGRGLAREACALALDALGGREATLFLSEGEDRFRLVGRAAHDDTPGLPPPARSLVRLWRDKQAKRDVLTPGQTGNRTLFEFLDSDMR